MTIRRNVKVAYARTSKHGITYCARAFGEETGNPGLPQDYAFRTATHVSCADSAESACRYAVARFLRDNPEYQDAPVFTYGRVSDAILSESGVSGLTGRNHCAGVALAYAQSAR